MERRFLLNFPNELLRQHKTTYNVFLHSVLLHDKAIITIIILIIKIEILFTYALGFTDNTDLLSLKCC